jgi:hypothetical protein
MSESRIVYTPRSDATPESEASALASAYRYLLNRHIKKEAAHPGDPDDAMKGSKHDRAKDIISK